MTRPNIGVGNSWFGQSDTSPTMNLANLYPHKQVLFRNSRHKISLQSSCSRNKQPIEAIIQGLVSLLKATLAQLTDPSRALLQAELHGTERLPRAKPSLVVLEALDLIAKMRLLLEPRQLILAALLIITPWVYFEAYSAPSLVQTRARQDVGYMSTKLLFTAAELNTPDILRCGAKTLP